MATKTGKLAIPAPCQQRWQDMRAEEMGRFCASCQKTVTDFSSLTDQQVVKLLARKDGSACGRFRANQLNRDLTVSTPVSNPASRLLGLLTAGLLGYQTVQADALLSKVEPIRQQVTQSHVADSVPSGKAEVALTDSVRVITGRVVGQADNVAIP